ncbi:MAG: 5-oxoprolinase subunit PxpB [Thermoanaerobaculia bacterium]|nr:5-oxoprolinase subunit PxpB [Thermoanaerobaculia bacterium]
MLRPPIRIPLAWRWAAEEAVLGTLACEEWDLAARGAHGLAARIAALPGAEALEIVPGVRSVLVRAREGEALAAGPLLAMREIEVAEDGESAGTEHRFAVAYGGAGGPDLAAVAAAAGLSGREAVALHAGALYTVAFVGFSPGFPYLLGLPPALRLPRRQAPRPRVPAGSVAVAGPFAGIYPQATPGGWHLLGHAETALFDPRREPPALLAAGDRVRFVPA